MAWMFTIAYQEYDCPRCKVTKGNFCRTPKGRRARFPHGERTRLLTPEQISSCRVRTYTMEEILDKRIRHDIR